MSATYSINIGQNTEATSKENINSILNDLPDNTSKLISPRDVRDAFFSVWANMPFKQTSGVGVGNYIGVDSGDPLNRDIKQKILLGKRSVNGADIINNNLLNNNDADIFFYNTKIDSLSQSQTKIAILAGTNSILHQNAPYIKSESKSNGIDLSIINPSLFDGSINLLSTTGRVSLNDVVFPTAAESASASNGQVLKYFGTYPNGVLKWSEPTISVSSIGTPGSETNLYGDVKLNGHKLEFVDNNLVPSTIGDIKIGDSFPSLSYNGQDWPLVEIIRKILYPYIAPTFSFSLTPTYLETNATTNVKFDYSITKYSNDIVDYNITNTAYNNLSYNGLPGTFATDSFYQNLTHIVGNPTQSFTLNISDAIIGSYTYSTTQSVYFINPVFATFSTNVLANLNTFNTTNGGKIIKPYPGISNSLNANIKGSGYLYFTYPTSYGYLKQIHDFNGFIIHDSNSLSTSAFTYSIMGNTNYNNTSYLVYRSKLLCSYTGNYDFKFTF